MKTPKDKAALDERYPWLARLQGTVNSIVETLYSKEEQYKGSWQQRGGIGAFMMMARKWDRIEGICREDHKYDVIQAGVANTADIKDDIDDLIAYLLLVRAKIDLDSQPPAAPDAEYRG